jgi:hypothetical protein
MVTIQFSLMSRKFFNMTAEQRVAALEDIEKQVKEAAARGEAYRSPGQENPFPPWLRDEICTLQGHVKWRRFWSWVLKILKVKAPVQREIKWDPENVVYKLVRVPDEEAQKLADGFEARYLWLLRHSPERTLEMQDSQLHISMLQDSEISISCDEDLWVDGVSPGDREMILGNVQIQGAARKEGQ